MVFEMGMAPVSDFSIFSAELRFRGGWIKVSAGQIKVSGAARPRRRNLNFWPCFRKIVF